MKDFKFLSNNKRPILDNILINPNNHDLYTTLSVNTHNGLNTINVVNTMNEYCFKFNDDEPIVFATSVDPLTITISGQHSNISFTNNEGNTFNLFSRPYGNI